jgi:hypothetical protein
MLTPTQASSHRRAGADWSSAPRPDALITARSSSAAVETHAVSAAAAAPGWAGSAVCAGGEVPGGPHAAIATSAAKIDLLVRRRGVVADV